MAYKITITINDWDRRGNACNIRVASVTETSDPIIAGKMFAKHGTGYAPRNSSTITAIDTETGAKLHAVDFYRVVVGDETFAAQEADENFSINLDDFFNAL